MSHETLAGLAGVHRSTVSRTESGHINPTFLVIHALCAALGLQLSAVLAEAEARVARVAGGEGQADNTRMRRYAPLKLFPR